MTPRQARIGVDIFTGIVAISIGVALAGLSWRLAGDPGDRFGSAPVAARPAKAVDIAPLAASAPFGTSSATPATQSTDQSLVLRGILLAVPISASSALISVGGAAPTAFYVGQQVGPGTIESIAVDHIVLTGGAGRQILSFPQQPGAAPAASADAPADAAHAPPTSVQTVVPPTAASQVATASAAGFLTGLGATVGGDGLHVAQATDRTRAAGLQPGDVIQKINNSPVDDLLQKPAALQALQNGGRAQILVSRGGQTLTLSVSMK